MSGKVQSRATRKRAGPKQPEKTNTVPEVKDPSPYLKKYRQIPKPMKQLTLNQFGELDKPLALPLKPETKRKYRIPKKKVTEVSEADDKPASTEHVGDMLKDVLKDISMMESNAKPNQIDLDKLLSKGIEITKNANIMPCEVKEKPSTWVNVDVFKLIAEKLLPHDQPLDRNLQLSEDFAFFEQYLTEKSVTEMSILSSVSDPVRHLQVTYVRLLMNYIENVNPEAGCEQFCLSENLVSLASQFKLSSTSSPHSFSPDDLFPPFYYAVQQLVKVYTNREQLPWLFYDSGPATTVSQDDEGDTWDSKYTLETQAARLRRRVEDVWSSLLSITVRLLQRSKLSDQTLAFNCSTGTAFLLVVLVAKNWYNLLFFNRFEPKLEAAVQSSKCWNLIVDFGRTISDLYCNDGVVNPAEEVIKLFYPFLLRSQQVLVEEEEKGERKKQKKKKKNGYRYQQQLYPLLLSYDEVDSLLCQLVDMNPIYRNQLQCAYFQMAFTSMHFHLVWEQLAKHQQGGGSPLTATDVFHLLEPYQSLSTVFTSWGAVFEMLNTSQSIPFTRTATGKGEGRELFWYEAKPALVAKLLLTLSTVVQKYFVTEYAIQSKTTEFTDLRSITGYFKSIVPRSQLMTNTILESLIRFLFGS